MTTRRPLAFLLFGLLACDTGGESHEEDSHAKLLPVAADEVPPLVEMPTPFNFAPPAQPAPAQANPAQPGQPAGPPAKLDADTLKAVGEAVALYKGFLDIAAKHPEDCKPLTAELGELAKKNTRVMQNIKKLEGRLSQAQMRSAQQKMQGDLPKDFFPKLVETAKRCEKEPGFQDAMNLLQGRAVPE